MFYRLSVFTELLLFWTYVLTPVCNGRTTNFVWWWWWWWWLQFADCYLRSVACIKGFELSYWSAVFITSVGHISEFPSAKQLTGLCGMAVGVGEIVGMYVSFAVLHSVSKKFPPLNSLQLCQTLTDFQNFCTAGKPMKFATKRICLKVGTFFETQCTLFF